MKNIIKSVLVFMQVQVPGLLGLKDTKKIELSLLRALGRYWEHPGFPFSDPKSK